MSERVDNLVQVKLVRFAFPVAESSAAFSASTWSRRFGMVIRGEVLFTRVSAQKIILTLGCAVRVCGTVSRKRG
jgi:hypothetical protein